MRILIATSILCLLANLPAFFVCSAQVATVPLNHQVYPLLQKAESLQLFSSYQLRLLPLNRAEIRYILWEINEHKTSLPAADASLLQQMLLEFTDPEPADPLTRDHDRHVYRLVEGETQFFFDMDANQKFHFQRNDLDFDAENRSLTTIGGDLRGMLSGRFGFGARACNTMIRGESRAEDFDVGSGTINVRVGDSNFTDQATGYFAGRIGRFQFLIGRDRLTWGAGLADRMAIGRNNEPMDMLRFNFDFRKIRFSYFHANLSGIQARRYLVGHRLDVLLSKRLQFGVYESLIYGGRDREWSYLNPILPYHVMEHQLGDSDNNMLGGDLSWFIVPGVRFFTEVFVDDFSIDYPLGTHWGNKFAIHSGIHWIAPFRLSEFDLLATYTRVDPWVYSHNDSTNIYSHYGRSIGSKLGANADRTRLQLNYQPHRDSRWILRYEFIRKGAGEITDQHDYQRDGRFKKFLAGTIEKSSEYTIGLRQQFKRDVFIGFEISWQKWQNYARQNKRDGLQRNGLFYLRIHY